MLPQDLTAYADTDADDKYTSAYVCEAVCDVVNLTSVW